MATYRITIDEQDWGTFEADSPEAAALACSQEIDHTRMWEVEALSDSESYGMGAPRQGYDGWGNAAQDRSQWLHISDEGGFVGWYRLVEQRPEW